MRAPDIYCMPRGRIYGHRGSLEVELYFSAPPTSPKTSIPTTMWLTHTLTACLWLCVCLFVPLSILVLYDLYYSFTTHTGYSSAHPVEPLQMITYPQLHSVSLPQLSSDDVHCSVLYVRKRIFFLRKKTYKPTFFPLFIKSFCLFYYWYKFLLNVNKKEK